MSRKCFRFSVNLHQVKDADIIDFINAVDNRQGLIKAAIRYYERGCANGIDPSGEGMPAPVKRQGIESDAAQVPHD